MAEGDNPRPGYNHSAAIGITGEAHGVYHEEGQPTKQRPRQYVLPGPRQLGKESDHMKLASSEKHSTTGRPRRQAQPELSAVSGEG